MKDEYKNIIDKLNEDQFNEFVRLYLQLSYEAKEVNICNGPWDGGNDACICVDGKRIKRNIQITVQDNIETKLESDLKKSKENVEEYQYASCLDFFYSHPLSHGKVVKKEAMALLGYNITLRIYDANKLGDDVTLYPELHDYLYRIVAPKVRKKGEFRIDKRQKVMFDTIIMGNNVSLIKENIITSYVLWYLHMNPGCNEDETYDNVASMLSISPSKVSAMMRVNPLLSAVNINDDGGLCLTSRAEDEISRKLQNAALAEEDLLVQIEKLLSNYGLRNISDRVLNLLHAFYEAHYNSEIDEQQYVYRKKLAEREISNKLRKEIVSAGCKQNVDEIVSQLITISASNEYLNKISASNLFVNLYKSKSLENYLDVSNSEIMLDTQILIRLLCLKYKNVDGISPMFDAVKYMMDILCNSDNNIHLMTTYAYAEEVASTLYEAKLLSRFLNLSFINKLGKSKNAFFNYYRYLESQGIDTFSTFDDFIQDLLGLDDYASENRSSFISIVSGRVMDILDYENIGLIDLQQTDYSDYQNWRRKYDICLDSIDSRKFEHARENDLLCLLYMSDSKRHVNIDTGLEECPYLVTWDSSAYPAREDIFKDYSRGKFYLYTPYKLANRLSLSSFKLNAQKLSREIISLINPSFETSSGSISFIDMISSIFPDREISEGKMASKLANMRNQLFENSSKGEFKVETEKTNPLDNILFALVRFAYKHEKKAELTEMFSDPQKEESIGQILKVWCEYYKKEKKIPADFYKITSTWLGIGDK